MNETATGTISMAVLIRRTGQGDRAAWARLIEARGAWVLAIARSIIGRTEAEDACHEAFLRLHAQAARFEPGGDPDAHAEAWMRRLAVNCCLNWRRQRLRRSCRESGLSVREPTTELQSHDRNQPARSHQELLDALAALALADRTAIIMRFWEDCSYEEAARAHGGTALAARVRLSRAVARLRKVLQAKGPDADERLAHDLGLCMGVLAARASSAGELPAGLQARMLAVPDSRIAAGTHTGTFGIAGIAGLAALITVIICCTLSMTHGQHPDAAQSGMHAAGSPDLHSVGMLSTTPMSQTGVSASKRWEEEGISSVGSGVENEAPVHPMLLTRRNGPTIALVKTMDTAKRIAGAIPMTTTIPSMLVSWDVADAGPSSDELSTLNLSSVPPPVQNTHCCFAMPALPARVKAALAPDLVMLDSSIAIGTAPSSSYICLCSWQNGSSCGALIMPIAPLAGWYDPGSEINAATAQWAIEDPDDGSALPRSISFLIAPTRVLPSAHG